MDQDDLDRLPAVLHRDPVIDLGERHRGNQFVDRELAGLIKLDELRNEDVRVAVALDDGLVAPVLRNAEMKSLSAISAEMKDFAARARDRKLAPSDYQGGSSAISNLGMYGVREFSAIINPPHATILAIGAARRQAVEKEDGGVAFASLLSVTLSCDHRVVDGALGAQLLAAFKGFVETPVSMLV